MDPYVLLALLVGLSTIQPLAFKVVSTKVDFRAGPVFIATWVLLGLCATFPLFGTLLPEGIAALRQSPYLLLLIAGKSVLLWFLFHDRLALAKQSLSAHSYFLPAALGVIAIINSFLGEDLALSEWVAALGLCALGIGFFLKGHLQELGNEGKILYLKLVFLSVALACIDQIVIPASNWYVLLLLSNLFMLLISLFYRRMSAGLWRKALVSPYAMLTGALFAVTELLKFYLLVTVLPMSVVISAQVAIIPVVLVLSAVLWKERQWHEQFVWGVLSAGLLLLLFL